MMPSLSSPCPPSPNGLHHFVDMEGVAVCKYCDRGSHRKPSLAAKLKAANVAAPHIVVNAYAGTGKTFSQIMGVVHAFALQEWGNVVRTIAERRNTKAGSQVLDPDTFEIHPSEEQLEIWQEMAKGCGTTKSIVYCAFNKSIVTEFSHEWGWLVKMLSERSGIDLQFATVNSLGNKTVKQSYGYLKVENDLVGDLLAKHLGMDIRELRRTRLPLLKGVSDLVDLCKLTLAGWTEEAGFSAGSVDEDTLDELVAHFDIEMNGSRSEIYELVPKMLEECLDPSVRKVIDFNDQNWLPVVNKLPVPRIDFGMVDEGQDLPRCKQEFLRLLFKRMMVVGDVNQAIYGFAGADVDSIPRMCDLLGGVQPLKLTETRRCGRAIVVEANRFVPGFKAHESNPEGLIVKSSMAKYAELCQDGDMVLCRVNAPLVSQALKFIRAGRKAMIRGRDFGTSLLSFIDRLRADDAADLVGKVTDWAHSETEKETKKRKPSPARLQAIEDRMLCLIAFSESETKVSAVREKIELIFAGRECPKCKKHYNETVESCYTPSCNKCELVTPKGVMFSTIHKAKGLEADRVVILQPPGAQIQHPMSKLPWQKAQDNNCFYIAITRAIKELVYVTEGEPGLRGRGRGKGRKEVLGEIADKHGIEYNSDNDRPY